jgi:hypothetical protein
MKFHCFFIESFSLSFNDGDGILRTMSETGTQAIAELIADQLCLAINDLNRSLSAVGNTKPATITLLLINPNNLSCCHLLFLPWIIFNLKIACFKIFFLDLSQNEGKFITF